MRILVIEDNEKLAASLVRGFTQEGYAADAVHTGEAGQERLRMQADDYDVVILDVMLPGKSGVQVCADARMEGIMTPILLLTARDTVEHKVQGLDAGADDYLVKPFSFTELLARVRALARRPRSTLPPELTVGEFRLVPATQEVFRAGEKLPVTLTEFRMLEYFMEKPGMVLSRQNLIDHLWDFSFNPLSRVMDVHINNLRSKIGDPHGDIIQTVRGLGYRFVA